jgi:hypothetical protein
MFERNFSKAVEEYGKAIQLAPTSAQLHALRSGALLDRGWEGDAWWALENCARALYFDLKNLKAHQRSIGALRALGQLQVRPAVSHGYGFESCAWHCQVSFVSPYMLVSLGTGSWLILLLNLTV